MTPLVLAHRGASWDAPENTLEAFELAIAQRADYVEFDVRAGEDGTLVVCHDPLTDRPPSDLCRLDEALEALRGRIGLAVEIKERRAAERTTRALQSHRIDRDNLIVLSYHARTLEAVRRLAPEVRMVLNLGLRPDSAAGARYWGVGFDESVAGSRPFAAARSLGLATFVFTVNEPARMLDIAGLEVDGIFTDRPALLRDTLAGRLPA